MKLLTFKRGLALLSFLPCSLWCLATGYTLSIDTCSISKKASVINDAARGIDNLDSGLVTRGHSKYDNRVHRYRKNWGALIPTQLVLQTCGNMGLFSFGIGWDYGKHRQWETQLLFGIIPKYDSNSVKMTMTLKENFIPWRVSLKKGWSFEPLECGLYFNTVFGSDFWTSQPGKYESGYYPFSTRIRPNIFIGEQFSKEISENKRKFIKSFTFFYELSTNDIYTMGFIRNGTAEFWDVFGLSLGLKVQLF